MANQTEGTDPNSMDPKIAPKFDRIWTEIEEIELRKHFDVMES